MRLYVTYWNPNGTNDLLVCDDDNQIVECVEDATFGINVERDGMAMPNMALIADDQSVFAVPEEALSQDTEHLARVTQVSLEYLQRKLCVSPIDPSGEALISRLKKAGIKF